MYRVVSIDITENVACLKVHFKSRVLNECWSFVERHGDQDFIVLDRADQYCVPPITGFVNKPMGDCVYFVAGNKLQPTTTFGRAVI